MKKIINSFFDLKKVNAAYAKKRRHQRLLSSIPEEAKMKHLVLTYDRRPSVKELNHHIRLFMKKIIANGNYGYPVLEYQVKNRYMPHWHVLINGNLNYLIARDLWRRIIKSHNAITYLKVIKKKELIDEEGTIKTDYSDDSNYITRAINYVLKLYNKDGNSQKFIPEKKSIYPEYKFKNTYLKKFVKTYDSCVISLNFIFNDQIICKMEFTRNDINIDICSNDAKDMKCFHYWFYHLFYKIEMRCFRAKNYKNKFKTSRYEFLYKINGVGLLDELLAKKYIRALPQFGLLYQIYNGAKLQKIKTINIYLDSNYEININNIYPAEISIYLQKNFEYAFLKNLNIV